MKPAGTLIEQPYAHQPPPAWARADGVSISTLEAGWFAGATLASLHTLVRAAPPFAGAWRNRLALQAAAASAKLAGHREDAAALRDAWFLRRPTDALSPAGAHLLAWRGLGRDSTDFSDAVVRRAAIGFGAAPDIRLDPLLAMTKAAERSHKNPLRRAAAVATGAVTIDPRHQFLGVWLADLVLARALRWPIPLPLLVTEMAHGTTPAAAGGPAKAPAGRQRRRPRRRPKHASPSPMRALPRPPSISPAISPDAPRPSPRSCQNCVPRAPGPW